MAFPITTLRAVSRSLLSDVLVRSFRHIPSVTHAVDVDGLIDSTLASVPAFYFRSNNEFGILVDLWANDKFPYDTTSVATSETAEAFAKNNGYADDLLNQISFSLAAMVITAHVILREQIPPEVTELMAKIEASLADRLEQDPLVLPSVKMQTWASIANADYQARMFQLGRSFAHIFEENRPIRSYYATAALAAAERLELATLPETLMQEANSCLRTVLGEAASDSDVRFFSNLLFRSYGVSNFVMHAQVALENGSELNDCLDKLAQVETLLQTLSAKTTETTMSAELSEWFASRIPVLEHACIFIAGAFYTLAVTSYRNSIILACHDDNIIVNQFCLPEFELAGGGLPDIQAFGFYLQLHGMTTPYSGWSAQRVLEMREVIHAELITARAETARRLQADNTVILRTVVGRVINAWTVAHDTPPWDKTPEVIVRRELSTLLTRVSNPALALADLLTDYLVEIRNNAVLKRLKIAIYQAFSVIPETAEPIVRQTAITQAMLNLLIDFLIEFYGERDDAAA